MENERNDCVEEKIKHFILKKEDKEKLLFFNDFIRKNKTKKKNNIVITIDNRPLSEINKIIGYIDKILKFSGMKGRIKEKKNYSRHNDNKFDVIWFNFDSEDISWKLESDGDELINKVRKTLLNNSLLIMSSTLPFDEITSFSESNILEVLPHISFHGEIDEYTEYKKLTNKYKNNNIKYEINLDDFSEIVHNINQNKYIRGCQMSDYLFDYSTKNYPINDDKVIRVNTFDKIVKKKETKESVNINDLIGLDSVKNELNQLFNYVEFLKEHNISRDETFLNMFFLGNPGTGKTMIAGIIADKLYELGFIEENEVVKVIPNDLIGEYVGQTSRKIRKILNNAKGKILFIDEAYLLYNGNYKSGNNPYMEEAIVELLKYLEDVNNITIFAGYPNEMKKIYEANPGIKSRIYKEIYFEDYSVDELSNILQNDLKKKGFKIETINMPFIQNYIKKLKLDKSFGNARTMKQLAQKLIINHASNYANGKVVEEMSITRLDIPKDNKDTRKEMGFGE